MRSSILLQTVYCHSQSQVSDEIVREMKTNGRSEGQVFLHFVANNIYGVFYLPVAYSSVKLKSKMYN